MLLLRFSIFCIKLWQKVRQIMIFLCAMVSHILCNFLAYDKYPMDLFLISGLFQVVLAIVACNNSWHTVVKLPVQKVLVKHHHCAIV